MTTYTEQVANSQTVTKAIADAAQMASTVDQKNAALVNFPPQWAATHQPAANAAASASKAAGAAGVKHVCTGIYASVRGGTTAPAAVSLTLNLRDGATGAGAVLASWTVVLAAAVGAKDEINIQNLNIPGSAATAMTLEFTAAGGLNTIEHATLFGYDVGA